MNYNWKFNIPNPILYNEYLANDIDPMLARILANRGLSYKDYDTILNRFWDLVNYYCENIPGLNAAAKFLNRMLLTENSKIYVFSDYDTDGITSGAIFHDFITTISQKNNYHGYEEIKIPERSDGYGLNLNWCKKIVEEKTKNKDKEFLVITFDNGISKFTEINYLRRNGINTIITDHHEPSRCGTPDGIVVDPKKDTDRLGEELCGAGIAWLLMYQLYRIYVKNNPKEDYSDLGSSLQRCLGFATIGTIGDIMPMTIFNLSLVYHGLQFLNDKKNQNKTVVSSLSDCFDLKEITSKDIGFSIGAAINACGQLGKANVAANMFINNKKDLVDENFPKKVCALYNQSKAETKAAKNQIRIDLDDGIFDDHLICIYTMKDIPSGIAGKLSNYISECTGKPAVVLVDINEKDEMQGSGRCQNPTLNLLELLKPLEDTNLIISAAGHKGACGVKFYRDKLDIVQQKLDEKIVTLVENGEASITPYTDLYIDSVISVKDICEMTYKKINSMPYSTNFYAPNFCLKGKIVNAKISQSNPSNICYTIADITDYTKTISIWVWNKKAEEFKIKEPKNIELVGNIVRNFMNPNQFTLDVVDVKFS